MADYRVGFIGVGRMGGRLAHRLINAGYELTIYDTSADAVRVFVEMGARAAGSPAELASNCEVVITCLPTPSVVQSVALGPKGIALIFEHYRIGTIDELERLCQEQKLRVLPRMGAKLEEKVLKSIASYRRRAGRFLLSFATEIAQEIIAQLSSIPGIEKITPAGSVRRGKERDPQTGRVAVDGNS